MVDAVTHLLRVLDGVPKGNLGLAKAHWLSRDMIAWQPAASAGADFRLHWDADGALELGSGGISGGQSLQLRYDPSGLDAELKQRFPHLAGYHAFRIAARDLAGVPDILRCEVVVSAVEHGVLADASSVQLPGVLDELYAYSGPLGVVWRGQGQRRIPTLNLWAPTARSVKLHLFADSKPATKPTVHALLFDAASGVWSVDGEDRWRNLFYLYEVEVWVRTTGKLERNLVTDPYSVSLALNSTRSQLVDLRDPALLPAGWSELRKPALEAPEDIVLYELHVRDFSIFDDSVPQALRGTFKAFTRPDSNGMRHLRGLAQAGLTHLHLLPVFDIATIEENKALRVEPDAALLATYAPDSEQQQAAVAATRDQDGFNWGYDPFHYTTPEGSYSTEPDGSTRIIEFREMVQALNQAGLRVVMDVVYNHTAAAGQDAKSVLDRVVPGYYHRLNAIGQIETSTCCSNTATEHLMMEKLMVDSLLTWAREYKVDGFRFDLMGHHSKANLLAVRAALDELTIERDGVDGTAIYMYGEGWNFGEVANNARFEQATQFNMAGTGIGTFNDRLRDAVRGGGPFSGLQEQGFATGLWSDHNGVTSGSYDDQRARLLEYMDWIRVGLAGNLADYRFENRFGHVVTGAEVHFNGAPTGYTRDPQEVITYVEAHDNETFWDILQLKAAAGTPLEQRVRLHNLANSLVMLGQGVPFFQAGQDLLRSKSLDRNSYNSGDWFNRLDWTATTNNWGVGLPPEENKPNWPIMKHLLGNPALKPRPEQIAKAAAHFRELLAIRKSSPLFRLRTADQIMSRVEMHNTGPWQTPGLVIMSIADGQGEQDLDERFDLVVVLFNANPGVASFTEPVLEGRALELHPLQQRSADEVVRNSRFDAATGMFQVPGRTMAVFVLPSK